MTYDAEKYARLITSEHNLRPRFMAMIRGLATPFASNLNTLDLYKIKFDLDQAVGQQLDVVGQWIGATRYVRIRLDDIYFSFDTNDLGFDEGKWYSIYNPLYETIRLDDEPYRTLLRAKIANNRWNGSIPDAYAVWETLFDDTGIGLLIQDLQGMHMLMAFTGPVLDPITIGLVTGGYLDLRPAGVRIDAYMVPTVADAPYFGFDVQNDSIDGFDIGAWGKVIVPDPTIPVQTSILFGFDLNNDDIKGFDLGSWAVSST